MFKANKMIQSHVRYLCETDIIKNRKKSHTALFFVGAYFYHMKMKLESLPNELLLDLFAFFNGVDLLRTFYRLNTRFDQIVLTHIRISSLDFHSVSKTDFDIICQQHLPSIVDRITSLCLSDDDETPEQTYYFLYYKLTLCQFTHLQSLSLSDIKSTTMMNRMMDDLCHLLQLQHLRISKCVFEYAYFERILCLPNLSQCHLFIDCKDWPIELKVSSLTLRKFSIFSEKYRYFSLKNLLKCTPYLQCLSIGRIYRECGVQVSYIIPSIEILKLSFQYTADGLENLLQHMPNLYQLTVEIKNVYLSGDRWESMITNHLPKLKLFRLMMQFGFYGGFSSESHVDEILKSFRTHFWIDEHQWFVRCHWGEQVPGQYYCLYTLPYTFTELKIITNMRFKSTCLDQQKYYSYDRIHSLRYGSSLSTNFVQIRFKLPTEDDFWSTMSTTGQLYSLIISLSANTVHTKLQLQALLDKASHLYSLELHSESTSHVSLTDITSKSVRRLNLIALGQCYNEEKCIAFVCSPLGIQCEVLTIEVDNRTNILYLVRNLKNLRALKVRCKDDLEFCRTNSDWNPLLSTIDDVAKWLKQELPATSCTISRDEYLYLKLWIRQ
jgi:hypothetical protein